MLPATKTETSGTLGRVLFLCLPTPRSSTKHLTPHFRVRRPEAYDALCVLLYTIINIPRHVYLKQSRACHVLDCWGWGGGGLLVVVLKFEIHDNGV